MDSKFLSCSNTCAHCVELGKTLTYLVSEHQKYLETAVAKIDLIEKILQSYHEQDKKQSDINEVESEIRKFRDLN